jgi:hypothetical protein
MKATWKVLAVFALLLIAPVLRADGFTYQYTGNPITPCGCSIDGWVTMAGPVSPYYNPITTPVAYSFTNGLITLTQSNSIFRGDFSVFPNQSQIDLWAFNVAGPGGSYLFSEFYGSHDEATDAFGAPGMNEYLQGNEGTWATVPRTQTPEPSEALFLISGMALLLVRRRIWGEN